MEEFKKWVSETAMEYAKGTVMDPEEHMDAVESIAYDFEEGARATYKYITGNELD